MPDRISQKKDSRLRRKKHIKKTVKGTPERPRMVVNRSLNHIYVQLIDDLSGSTLLATSTCSKDISKELVNAKSKCDKSKIVGKQMAELAKKKKISKVVFDRNGYLYHGRVKALSEGAREGGLEF